MTGKIERGKGGERGGETERERERRDRWDREIVIILQPYLHNFF